MFGGTIREKSKVLHFVEIASFDHHEAQAIAISVGLLVYVVEVSGDSCLQKTFILNPTEITIHIKKI